MKAFIFAAGLGTRLRPLTDSMPKALVEVGGMPAMQHAIENIKRAGIKDVVINVHHFPDMIREFLERNDNFGLNVKISDESDLLVDTGGGLYKALPLLGGDDPVLLHNADIVTDIPLADMMSEYSNSRPDALLLVSGRASSRRLLFDASGNMNGWQNVATGKTKPAELSMEGLKPLAFCGVHIIAPSMFSFLKEYAGIHGPVFSITPFYIAACRRFNITAFVPGHPFKWHDIGRPESLKAARNEFRDLL